MKKTDLKMTKKPSLFVFICMFTISFLLVSCGGAVEAPAPAESAEPAETAIPSPTITPTQTQTATPTPTITPTPTEEPGMQCDGLVAWDLDGLPGDEVLCKNGWHYYCLESCQDREKCSEDGDEVEAQDDRSDPLVMVTFLCEGDAGWSYLRHKAVDPAEEPAAQEPSDYQFSSPKGRVFFNEEGAQYNSDINSNKGILVITAENAGLKIT
ncbi:hypothetical protein KKC91_01935, partial [bacterium]|nr:hypothetical protein [bacterium]